jgi:ComF family protein
MLGHFLAAHPAITGPYDALVPLPLHPRRLRERGFNQAAELAKPLAKRLGAPLDHAALRRLVVTRPQAGLSPKDRKRNVRDVFQASCSVAGRRLLIVDDIATTCASLEAAATALRNAGAASVDAAVVARTSGNK